ncbi:MAG TPA: hypothetical protein VFV67_28670 [Actinophytocola sp.]|uniref:hypothetical protein n=1 Tax=Actinophytocola sp. TaxID=1872138 RepID=UPI002DBF8DEA|nr:hypothetical protein [Actinophytocola sp.]HEU5474640.1 hypothetical protein [Actinophytocola sp.]
MSNLPSSLHEFAAGDESDLQVVVPWAGPAIDPATGGLRGPLPESYLVATSVGWPKPGHEEIGPQLNKDILEELWQRDGLLAATLAVSAKSWNASRNLVLWRDKAALDGFLRSPAHLRAARRTRGLMFDWEGTHWTATARSELPTFAEARARLDAARAPGRSDFHSPD